MSSAITEKYIVDYCETLTAEERLLIVKKILNIEDKKTEIIEEKKEEIIEDKKEELIEYNDYNEEDDRALPKAIIEKKTRDISIREQFCMLIDVLKEMENENIIYNVSSTAMKIDTNEFQYFYINKKINARNVVKRENDKIIFKHNDKLVKERLTKKWREKLLIYVNNITHDDKKNKIYVYLFNDNKTYDLKKLNKNYALFNNKELPKQHLLNIIPKYQMILTNRIYNEKLEYYKEKLYL